MEFVICILSSGKTVLHCPSGVERSWYNQELGPGHAKTLLSLNWKWEYGRLDSPKIACYIIQDGASGTEKKQLF